MRSGPVASGALVLAVLLLGACRQTIGIDQYFNAPADAGAGTSACGLPYGTSACASCVASSCCNESSACATDPVCSPLASCLGKCNGDAKCRSQCMIDNPVGTSPGPEVSALSACLASKCETACGLTCGGVAGLSEPDAAGACQSCFAANACAHARACASSVDCDAFMRCRLGAHIQLGEACASASDAGATLASSLVQDWTGTCATPCAAGGQWACVGHVSWPHPTSPVVTLALSTTDFVSNLPVSALDVSVCSYADLDCSQPLAQGQTDATGSVVFTIPNRPDGTGRGLNGYWKLSPTSQGYGLQFLWWGFPLSTARFSYSSTLGSESFTQQLFSTVGVTTLDPLRGQISAQVSDCAGNLAPGVQITTDISDPLMREIYGAGGLSATATDSTGIALFANVPVGVVTLTATPLALGKASSRQVVQVRAGAWNFMPMPVTP